MNTQPNFTKIQPINIQYPIIKIHKMEENNRKYDLEDRTREFAEEAIELCYKIKTTPITEPIIKQLIRSSTSIGANYCEAIETGSKKDFRYKLLIAKKEAKETLYWLRLLSKIKDVDDDKLKLLNQECRELILILSASVRKVS